MALQTSSRYSSTHQSSRAGEHAELIPQSSRSLNHRVAGRLLPEIDNATCTHVGSSGAEETRAAPASRQYHPPTYTERVGVPMYTERPGHMETVVRSEELDRIRARDMLREFNLSLAEDGIKILGADKEISRAIKASIAEPEREQLAYVLFADTSLHLHKDKESYQPLHWAAYYGSTVVVLLLTAAGINPNTRTANHWTPLHWAAFFGHSDIVSILLSAGAQVNAQTEKGLTALHWAAQRGHLETVETLLYDGEAVVNLASGVGRTPLHEACTHGHLGIVKLLLDAGAGLDERGDNKSTALHCSAQGGHLEILKLLIERGGDYNARCRNKKSVRGVTLDRGVKDYLKEIGAVK